MLKDAIEKILSLKKIESFEIEGRQFVSDKIHLVKKSEHVTPEALAFNTLEGLCNWNEHDSDFFFHIINPKKVEKKGRLQPENENNRFVYSFAFVGQNSFEFNRFYDLEIFIIKLQSQFVLTDDLTKLLSVVGNMANEQTIINNDSGTNQTVQVKTGITTKANVTISNPLSLKPYRTFRDVDQPESNFVVRFKGTDNSVTAALFEADGGEWEIEAINNIRNYIVVNTKTEKVFG
jgi:hypothetical protein